MSLRTVMQRQGRRHVWLAEQTGKSPSYITRVLNGERNPSPEFRIAAAKALGMDERDLFEEAKPAA